MKIDNRLTMLIVGVLAIAGLAGGWFLGVEPQLSVASATDSGSAGQQQPERDRSQQITEQQAQDWRDQYFGCHQPDQNYVCGGYQWLELFC